MKRSDIRNAYDLTNPTRDQKDKMLMAILNAAPEQDSGPGKYISGTRVEKRWNLIPAVMTFLAVLVAGIFVLTRQNMGNNEVSSIQVESESLQAFLQSDQYKASMEWFHYVKEYEAANGAEISQMHAPSYYGMYYSCYNDEMAAELDSLCERYGLSVYSDSEGVGTGSYGQFLKSVGIANLFHSVDGVEHVTQSFWIYPNGDFVMSDRVTMGYSGSPWTYPIDYSFVRTSADRLQFSFWMLGPIENYDYWEYTTRDGHDLLIAVGDDAAFMLMYRETELVFAQISNHRVEDALYGEVRMDKTALEAFAETFDFTLRPAQEEVTTAEAKETELKMYDHILNLYVTAIAEKWNPGKCAEEGISILIANYVENPELFGYTLMDLDGNGTDELIITDGNVILDLYTLTENGPKLVFSGWERNVYYLCDGNYIFNRGSNGAANTLYNLYRYYDGDIISEETVTYDATADPAWPWSVRHRSNPSESITEEEANEIINSYVTLSINFSPVTELN